MDIQSDKHYWHRYTAFYERIFSRLSEVQNVLEFGVLHGDSIRWLRQRFPAATIVGADILPVHPGWPRDDRIIYRQVDQADRKAISGMLEELGTTFDLIIEDGSHIPEHQASCLILGFPRLRSGGVYMLEDIHTSHPQHSFSSNHPRGTPNSLCVLLALQHLKETGQKLSPEVAQRLSRARFFSVEDIQYLAREIGDLELYKRTRLPLRCYACGSSQFDYAQYRCPCGAQIWEEADSMSFALTRA